MKVCAKCKEEKPRPEFGTRNVQGIPKPQPYCRACRVSQSKTYHDTIRFDSVDQRKTYFREKSKRRRAEDIPATILGDSRKSDKKKGRPNDLTKDFIAEQIANGCSYCGETELRMTLDRIDNDAGHTKDNVVPACYRCNHTRGNMPHEAWLYLTDGMRRARLAGSFGDWSSKPFSRK